MTTMRARADAAHQEEKTSVWRDWCSYLRAHQSLIALHSIQASRSAFEREESGEEAESEAQGTLHAIPAARRILFDAIREQRRQEIQTEHERNARMNGSSHRMLDIDALDRAALSGLLDEAEGRSREDGWGLVPLGSPDQIEWYCLDVAALSDAPQAALYLLGQTNAIDRQKRIRLIGMLAISAAMVVLVWAIWPKGSPPSREVGRLVPAIVNGSALETRWVPQTLIIRTPSDVIATLPISATNTALWATILPNDPQHTRAMWWQEQPFPLVLCVPSALLQEATELSIQSAGDAPERRYVLRAAPESAGDLRLEACQSTRDSETIRVRYGALQSTEAITDADLGQEQNLTNASHLTLRKLTILGAGDDPTLPVGQSRVVVDASVRGSTALDWPTLAPTLLLASGDALLPGAMVPISDGMQLTYLIPTPLDVQAAVWRVTPPGQDRPLRWRIQLTPPPSRDAILSKYLEVRQVTAQAQGDTIQIVVTVITTGTTSMQLSVADITLTQDEQAIPLPNVPELAAALIPGEERSLLLAIPRMRGRSVVYTIGIGAAQFRLTVPAD